MKVRSSFLSFLLTVSFLGALFVGGVFTFEKFIWNDIDQPSKGTSVSFNSLDEIQHYPETVDLDSSEPFAMLLLGVDGDNFENNRTDSIMVAVVNPDDSKVSLLSIPRDLKVTLTNGKTSKINAAYPTGGVEELSAVIKSKFDVDIKYFANINFNGFIDFVDVIGGVKVNVEKDITFSDRITRTTFSLNKGEQKLNGIQALNYSRYRGDGEGDFGRMRRQQQVVKALLSDTVSLRNVPKILDVLDVINTNFSSNISYSDLGKLAIKMRNIDGTGIESIKFDAYPTMSNGISYVEADEDEFIRISNDLSLLLSK